MTTVFMQPELTALHTPASIIGIFNNALRLPQTVTLLHIKGKYTPGAGKSYAGYFYDLLYSESDNSSIGLKVSGLLRAQMVAGEVYVLMGFIEKSIRNSSIELRFAAQEIISKEEKRISEDDLKRFELIQKKLELGSVDIETLIRNRKIKNEPVRIANLYGHSAIVQKDFMEGLDATAAEFDITEYTCNITSATSILAALRQIPTDGYDIIALVRGGGDRQSFDAFSDVSLAEYFISLPALTVTAIGHSVDETLLDRLSDRRYHLPHDYGSGLRDIVEKISQEKSNSRALLIDEVKKDVSKQFSEQVRTLDEQLKKKNEEFLKLQHDAAQQIRELQTGTENLLKARAEETEKQQKNMQEIHDKNIVSAVTAATATLLARAENLELENKRLTAAGKLNWVLMLIVLLAGLFVGYLLFS